LDVQIGSSVNKAAIVSYLTPSRLMNPYGNLGVNILPPNGFDQFAALYEKYLVVGCALKIRPIGYDQAGFAPGVQAQFSQASVYVAPISYPDNTANIGVPDESTIVEHQYMKQFSVPSTARSAVNAFQSFSTYFSSAKALGVSQKKLLSEDDFAGPYTRNQTPKKEWLWGICIAPVPVSATTNGATKVTLHFEVVQYVKLYDPKQIPSSAAITPTEQDELDNFKHNLFDSGVTTEDSMDPPHWVPVETLGPFEPEEEPEPFMAFEENPFDAETDIDEPPPEPKADAPKQSSVEEFETNNAKPLAASTRPIRKRKPTDAQIISAAQKKKKSEAVPK
jgi:hypothetical protein